MYCPAHDLSAHRPRSAGALERWSPRTLFLQVDLTPTYAAVILPSMLLLGAACALVFPSLNIQATSGVENHEQGMVSGLLNTSIQVGRAIFLAVVTAVITAGGGTGRSAQAVLDSFRPGLGW